MDPLSLPSPGRPDPLPPVRKIALEEHFNFRAPDEAPAQPVKHATEVFDLAHKYLLELDDARIRSMDASAIDLSILSLLSPGVQAIADVTGAVEAARKTNDFLAERIAAHPGRFAGFATLPMQDPLLAADELERCIERLGFKGALVNGYTNVGDRTAYLDEPAYLPFWERAAALSAPLYLHPRVPLLHAQGPYEGHPYLAGASWGFAAETGAHALRLVYSGLFDRFPRLTVILGHLGEMIPFFAWRIQHSYEFHPGPVKVKKRLQDYLCENFYITTSGNLSAQALICAMLTIGAERILFATDYPFEMMEPAARWLEEAPISENDRRNIAHRNACRLFNLPPVETG